MISSDPLAAYQMAFEQQLLPPHVVVSQSAAASARGLDRIRVSLTSAKHFIPMQDTWKEEALSQAHTGSFTAKCFPDLNLRPGRDEHVSASVRQQRNNENTAHVIKDILFNFITRQDDNVGLFCRPHMIQNIIYLQWT